jgi:hypothetical protein
MPKLLKGPNRLSPGPTLPRAAAEQVEEDETCHIAQHLIGDDLVANPHRPDDLRVKEPVKLPGDEFEHNHNPDQLYRSGGGTSGAAKELQNHENSLGKGRPLIEVSGKETGGGDDGDYLKEAVAQGFPEG